MKSAFNSRRKARKVGQDDDDGQDPSPNLSTKPSGEQENSPSDRRLSSLHPKPQRKSALRLSFGPGETSNAEGCDPDGSEVFQPRKSNLSRKAIEKNALRRSMGTALPPTRLPLRAGEAEDRPTYSSDYLSELKSSTPTTPRDLKISSDAEDIDQQLELSSNFPPSFPDNETSSIPSEAEIREKKERRARLAQEKSIIGLDASDEEQDMISLRPREKYPETRLVAEDEDIVEGFDALVSDGKLSLGRRAEKAAKRRRRLEMKELIHEAEGGSADEDEESEDDEEADRKAAYDLAQTRAGTYGSTQPVVEEKLKMRVPSKITPLPTLKGVLGRLQGTLARMETQRMIKMKRLDALRKEQVEIATREGEVQRLLKEMGENYEKLRSEAGLPLEKEDRLTNGGRSTSDRGLESFGNTPIPMGQRE